MRVVVQRVSEASVKVEGKVVGAIQQGLLVLVGIEHEDTSADADWLIGKLLGLRIFSDEEGKMNLSVQDVNGELLVISQFTLHAATKKGNRPSFIKAAPPEKAIPLYTYFIEQVESIYQREVKRGIFGADMKVALINDGPVTIIMDSKSKE